MSAEHRKPLVAFIALAFAAAVLVGVHRADAQTGRFLASVLASPERVHGLLPELSASSSHFSGDRGQSLESAFGAIIIQERRIREQLRARPRATESEETRAAESQGRALGKDGQVRAAGEATAMAARESRDLRRVGLNRTGLGAAGLRSASPGGAGLRGSTPESNLDRGTAAFRGHVLRDAVGSGGSSSPRASAPSVLRQSKWASHGRWQGPGAGSARRHGR